MTTTVAPAIALDNLTLGYGRHPAVHHLTGQFPQGSLTAVVGPNGAGKSTLLKGMSGELRPLSGGVRLHSQRLAYLPQQADLERQFPISVRELVSFGHWNRVGWFGAITRHHQALAEAAIDAVGLAGFERRPIGSLSGGQLQRVLFARLLLQDADVVLLDEPFTAIDSRTTGDLLQLVQRWHGEGRTVIGVLHDLDLVREHFPHCLLLSRQLIAWDTTDRVLTPDHWRQARDLNEAWDDRAPLCPQV